MNSNPSKTPTPSSTTNATPNNSNQMISQEELNHLLISRHEESYVKTKEMIQNSKETFVNGISLSNVPNMLPPLARSQYDIDIAYLKRITIRDLETKRNEKCFIHLKVVRLPWKIPGPSFATNVLLIDHHGDVIRGAFYNVLVSDDWKKLEEMFSLNREVIILHPFFRIAQDGLPTIRVENRYEFRFVDEIKDGDVNFEDLVKKIKELKEEGNSSLKSNLNQALQKYYEALDVVLKEKPHFVLDREDFFIEWRITLNDLEKPEILQQLSIIFSNISLAFIEKKQPLLALYNAKFSLWCNGAFFKANLRVAKAMIDLFYAHEAKRFLSELKQRKEAEQSKDDIKKLEDEADQRIRECSSERAVVDFLSNELNWPEERAYLGAVELFKSEGKGRGFKATRNILKGETILIETGFVHEKSNPEFCYDLLSKLDGRLDLKTIYMNLYPSPKHPLPDDLKGAKEEYVREYSVKSNFQLYRSDNPKVWSNFTDGEIDELLIKSQLNNFQVNKNVGIFPHFCLFNQACDPNVSIWYSKNMVMLLAKRDIPKGEEVFVHYVSLDQDTPQRKSKLLEYGFNCNCLRCSRKGEWKEKEAKVSGLKCPKCHSEVAVTENKKLHCAKDGWEADATYCEEIEKKVKDFVFQVQENPESKDTKQLEEFLEMIRENFADYHINKAVALDALAQRYAEEKQESKFVECFKEIVKMSEFFASTELLIIINNMLIEILDNFERDPTPEELGCLSNFGFTNQVIKELWGDFLRSGKKGWILHF
jgi:ssDNA-binding Zn-finger/Zn-ribbon topoisomerase 1